MAICPSCNQEKGCTCGWPTAKNGLKVCTSCIGNVNSQPMIGNSPGSSSGNKSVLTESLKITPPPIKTLITPEITGVKYNNFRS